MAHLVCPRCKGTLTCGADPFWCARCWAGYGTIRGFPDFRVYPTPYYESSQEEALTKRLEEVAPRRNFADLVRLYYSLTPGTPTDLVERRVREIATGVDRGRASLRELGAAGARRGVFLEVGCGTGGLLVAAAQAFDEVVGVDIVARWLILARKRLEEMGEMGRHVELVSACAEHLPFADASFEVVAAQHLIEHLPTQREFLDEIHRVLKPGGTLFLATPNRWSLAPEPHVNVWGVGFLPTAWRDRYVRIVRRLPYRDVWPLNYFDVRRLVASSRFEHCHVGVPDFPDEHVAMLPRWQRSVMPIYRLSRRAPVARSMLRLFGPLYHIVCIKRQGESAST